MTKEEFRLLLDKYLQQQLSDKELADFFLLLEQPGHEQAIKEALDQDFINSPFSDLSKPEQALHSYDTFKRLIAKKTPNAASPVRRLHYLRTAWFRYAAAIILLLGGVTYLWVSGKKTEQTLANSNKANQAAPATDIAPGSDKAVLTLSDGSTILLDSATNGTLAKQGGTQVVKLADGTLAYQVSASPDTKVFYNTMETRRGGKYRLILPDGSKVWLNSSSSIRYPNVFAGQERNVEITGEAYFEIAKDASKPFKVISGGMAVQVLGTEFNIMAYADEGAIRTTLVNGSVLITKKGQSKQLNPGEQLSIGNAPGGLMVSRPDLEEVLAWKNGLFNFKSADIYTVMRQLSRWYDIDVRYEGKAPAVQIIGKMDRGLNLADILEFLAKMEIKFRMEGRTIIVAGT
jgi:transmembrane sensor